MVNGLGAFAGGLAQGLRAGQEMNLRQQYMDEQKKSSQRKTELHQAKIDEIESDRKKLTRLRAANGEIVAGWQRNLQGEPIAPAQSAAPGLSGELQQRPWIIDTKAAGLSSLKKPPVQPSLSSDEMIGKRMLTGNLSEIPDELTRMAGIYKKYDVLEEMAPWMNQVYSAKKKRIPDALQFLLNGDARGAREILKEGGVNLVSNPVPASNEDMLRHNWRLRLQGGEETDIDLRELAAGFFPESYLGIHEKD